MAEPTKVDVSARGVDSLMEVLGHAELKAVQRYGSRSRERTRRAMQVFESGGLRNEVVQ